MDLPEWTRARTAIILLLPVLFTTISHSQEPRTDNPATASAGSPVGSRTTSAGDRVILKVGDVKITQAAFEGMIKELEEQQGTHADVNYKVLADDYASMLMLSQRALEQHLESKPEVAHQLAIDRTQILSNAEYARLQNEAKPGSEEVSQYYNAHLDDYDLVQIRRLFIWKKPQGASTTPSMGDAEAHVLADAVRKAYGPGGDPRTIKPQQDNVVLDRDPLSFQRGQLPEYMEKAAFSLKEGEWAVLEDKPDALILIQLVKRSRKGLDQVSPQIESKLQAENLRKKLEDLKAQSGVWMDTQYFATAAASVSGGETRPTQRPGEQQSKQQ